MNIVLFSGGRGTNSITKAILENTDFVLNVIVNAYDNGKSTGLARKLLPGMLGPSDIRKNYSVALNSCGFSHLSILLEKRLLIDFRDIDSAIEHIEVELNRAEITRRQYDEINNVILKFLKYVRKEFRNIISEIPVMEWALGNLYFSGLFLARQDFNETVKDFQKLQDISNKFLVYNVTNGKNLFLHAKVANSNAYLTEEEIVENQGKLNFENILLSETESLTEEVINLNESIRPVLNPEISDLIISSNMIVYGPGTQLSSLVPTYLTQDLSLVIASNKNCEKILITNLEPDMDIPDLDLFRILEEMQKAFNIDSKSLQYLDEIVTALFVNQGVIKTEFTDEKIARFFQNSKNLNIEIRDFGDYAGKHIGSYILNLISKNSQNYLEKIRKNFITLVLYSEDKLHEKTFAEVATFIENDSKYQWEVLYACKNDNLLLKEVVSKHTSINWRRIELHTNDNVDYLDRVSVISRGDLICIFPISGEYKTNSIYKLVKPLIEEDYGLVIGSRNIRQLNLRSQIENSYYRNKFNAALSYYMGKIAGLLLVLRYNLYITDPFSQIRALKMELFQSITKNNAFEIAQLLHVRINKQYIIEVPVDSTPIEKRANINKVKLAVHTLKELLRS